METTAMSKADFIKQFCSADGLRPLLEKPFHVQGWNAATNGLVLVGYRGEIEHPEMDADNSFGRKCTDLLSGTGDALDLHISLRDLDRVLALWPMEDEKVSDECKACSGEGEIECECCDCGDAHEAKCKACNGAGEVNVRLTGKRVPVAAKSVRLTGVAQFAWATLHPLAQVLRAAEVAEAHVTHGSSRHFMRVVAGEFVAVLAHLSEGRSSFDTIELLPGAPKTIR